LQLFAGALVCWPNMSIKISPTQNRRFFSSMVYCSCACNQTFAERCLPFPIGAGPCGFRCLGFASALGIASQCRCFPVRTCMSGELQDERQQCLLPAPLFLLPLVSPSALFSRCSALDFHQMIRQPEAVRF
jgi:hypothetical protein